MANPSHWWKFEEASGNSVLDEIGGVTGSLVNATRITPGYSSNAAVHINGTDGSYVSFGNQVGQFGTNDFTVSFWVSTTETIRLFDLFGTRTASSNGNFLSIRMTGNHESQPHGMVSAEVDEDGNGKNYIGVSSNVSGLNDGKWHNIAVVRQGNRLTLYVDGAAAGSQTGAGVANLHNGNDLRLGRSLSMNVARFAPNALFDDIRIWNSAETPNPGLSLADLRAAIARYAPIMQFHPQERYLPCSVEWFLQNALLCSPSGKVQATPTNLPTGAVTGDEHAHWLELKADSFRAGNLPSAVAYVHAKPAAVPGFTDIAFWFCYAFNGPGSLKAFPFSDRIEFDKFGEHTADWETVTLRIDNATKTLKSMYLAQHDSGEWITDLGQLTMRNSRPVIYASQNGHASYAHTGNNPTHESSKAAPWPFSGDIYDFYLINACADGGPSLDCAAKYVLVSADYLGADKPAEPAWLNYLYRWGPHIVYPAGALDNFLNSLGIAKWLLGFLVPYVVSVLPGEVKDEDGPTGPKAKGSWLGRPED